MSKGLYHCSKCKKRFYDAEATAMHIKDAHGGDGHVLRHPTKRELLVQAEIKDRRIAELEAKLAKAQRALLAISKWEVGPSGTTGAERSIKNFARATLAELEDGK